MSQPAAVVTPLVNGRYRSSRSASCQAGKSPIAVTTVRAGSKMNKRPLPGKRSVKLNVGYWVEGCTAAPGPARSRCGRSIAQNAFQNCTFFKADTTGALDSPSLSGRYERKLPIDIKRRRRSPASLASPNRGTTGRSNSLYKAFKRRRQSGCSAPAGSLLRAADRDNRSTIGAWPPAPPNSDPGCRSLECCSRRHGPESVR